MAIDEKVYRSESETGHRNRASPLRLRHSGQDTGRGAGHLFQAVLDPCDGARGVAACRRISEDLDAEVKTKLLLNLASQLSHKIYRDAREIRYLG